MALTHWGQLSPLAISELLAQVLPESLLHKAAEYVCSEERIPMKKLVYTVYEVDNGYLAELPGGRIVVADSLVTIASAANAAAVTVMLSDDPPSVKKGQQEFKQWTKVQDDNVP